MFRRCATLLALSLTACGGGETDGDAGADVPVADHPTAETPGGLHVDFTVKGCAKLETVDGMPHCYGAAPLTLTFYPVTSPSVGNCLWELDEGASSAEPTPEHVYEHPGRFKVSLTVVGPDGAEAGTGSRTLSRDDFVIVEATKVGGPCDEDDQCEAGRMCLCKPSTKTCPSVFARGLCTNGCPSDCGEGGVCADLALSVGEDAEAEKEEWRKPFCLKGCMADADCAPGWRCRDLPTPAGTDPPWQRACFLPAHPRDVGQPCRNATGFLSNSLCTTGVCADIGALGACSLDCSTATCPPGSACAKLGDGRALCLRACSGAGDCASDPLLGCEAPGAAGALGFTITAGADASTYCAPRRCASSAECGPAGSCVPSASGHCVRG